MPAARDTCEIAEYGRVKAASAALTSRTQIAWF
jgi:hypothetical protein